MPEKKNEAKKNGLRGIFRRKESGSESIKSANDTESKPQEQSQRPPARRTYTPRYAARDMILTVPVEDRPDLVAKAKQNNLRRICSDIGFSTGSSSHARSASLNLNALSTHPNFHISRHAAMDLATPGISSSSTRSPMMYKFPSMPAVPLQQSSNAMELQWRGLSYSGPPSFPSQKRRPRNTQSLANIPKMIPESKVEHMGHGFDEMNVSEDGKNADNDSSSRASTPSSGYTPQISCRPRPTPVRQRSYFSHSGPLPDLRAQKYEEGKGKEPSRDGGNDQGRSPTTYNQPAHRASYESVSNYVISTKPLRAAQTAPASLPPPPPSTSEYPNSHRILESADIDTDSESSVSDSPRISGEHIKDSRAPSVAESESNGTDRSSVYNHSSPRTSSLSTVLTAPSDAEDAKTERAVKVGAESGVKQHDQCVSKVSLYIEEEEKTELLNVKTAETTKAKVEA